MERNCCTWRRDRGGKKTTFKMAATLFPLIITTTFIVGLNES